MEEVNAVSTVDERADGSVGEFLPSAGDGGSTPPIRPVYVGDWTPEDWELVARSLNAAALQGQYHGDLTTDPRGEQLRAEHDRLLRLAAGAAEEHGQ